MKIGVIGAGFVGLVTASCLANKKNNVTCIEKNKDKYKKLQSKKIPFFEPSLKEIFNKKYNKSLFFQNDYNNINQFDVIFITVGTPYNSKGVDLSFLENSIKNVLKEYNGKKKILIAIKSTIPPGTSSYLKKKFFKKKNNLILINNPEFLREGNAVNDFISPDRIIVGTQNKKANIKKFLDLYKSFRCNKFLLSYEESEVSKYYSNSFFASLISFSNQFAHLCDNIPNCNFENINKTLMSDKRILVKNKAPLLKNYLIPGIGFGGSCFPKDVEGIKKTLNNKKINNSFLKSILNINKESLKHGLKIIRKNFNKSSKICILGAAFKENSDDTRESRTIYIANKLTKEKFNFDIIDPKVKKLNSYNCKLFKEKNLKKYKYFILMTRWKIFNRLYNMDFDHNVKIIDFRRYFSQEKFKSKRIKLISIGNSSLI